MNNQLYFGGGPNPIHYFAFPYCIFSGITIVYYYIHHVAALALVEVMHCSEYCLVKTISSTISVSKVFIYSAIYHWQMKCRRSLGGKCPNLVHVHSSRKFNTNAGIRVPLWYHVTLGVLVHSSSCCCSNLNEGTLLLCISVYAVSVDVLMHAVDLRKTASR